MLSNKIDFRNNLVRNIINKFHKICVKHFFLSFWKIFRRIIECIWWKMKNNLFYKYYWIIKKKPFIESVDFFANYRRRVEEFLAGLYGTTQQMKVGLSRNILLTLEVQISKRKFKNGQQLKRCRRWKYPFLFKMTHRHTQ